MAEYGISGVWKDTEGVITHYALHEVTSTGPRRAVKTSKEDAILLLEGDNIAITWIWNYKLSRFTKGEGIHIVDGSEGKFLRSNPDSTVTDNLGHLINCNWFQTNRILRAVKK